MSGIRVSNLTIDSPASVGGIFGNVGKPAERKNSNIAILLQPQDSQMTYGVAFNNCSYQNLNVTGKYAAGGICWIYWMDVIQNRMENLSVNPATTVSGQTNNQISGQNSTISADI